MKETGLFIIALAAGSCASFALAEDSLEAAKKYVEFWQPVEGRWEVTVEMEGAAANDDAGTVVWSFVKSPTGVCYIGDVSVNGEVTGHGIHGYDPEHKCWHFMAYGIPQRADDPLHSTVWVHIDLSKSNRLTTGTTLIVEGKDVMTDGTVINTRSRWTWLKVQTDVVEILFTEGTRNGEPVPNSKMVLERKTKRNRPNWRLAEVTRGSIVSVVNSTGEVKPVLSIQVGSFVSGPIDKIHVDFNDEVKKDDLLAEIDPVLFQADVARDKAVLATAQAEVVRAKALRQQANNEYERALALRAENEDHISETELDQYKFNLASLDTSVSVAEASVKQAQASLEHSQRNLGHTKIRAPADGIIIDRKIDPGQTLAAQFQTPKMFILAPRMREKMHIFAWVDEADIGLVKAAKDNDQPVHFTVDAYPEELFDGAIEQIRMSSTSVQNVVTYPVVVAVTNPDLKLLPGMTVSISFQTEEKHDVVKIPNAALRFYPELKQVRPEDRKVLEGAAKASSDENDSDTSMALATEKAEAQRKRHRRHVWLAEGEFLRVVEIVTGLSDNKYTEYVSGDIKVGQKLVTGVKRKKE